MYLRYTSMVVYQPCFQNDNGICSSLQLEIGYIYMINQTLAIYYNNHNYG